jgi:hypothetical protein
MTPYNAYPTTHNHNATGTIYVHVSGENKTSQDFRVYIIDSLTVTSTERAVVAVELMMISGTRSSLFNSLPMSGASRLPSLLSGLSWSANSGCFQLDLA